MTRQEINNQNIDKESYYNLCKLSESTKYWNPLKAFQLCNLKVEVEKDQCGNIVKVYWDEK